MRCWPCSTNYPVFSQYLWISSAAVAAASASATAAVASSALLLLLHRRHRCLKMSKLLSPNRGHTKRERERQREKETNKRIAAYSSRCVSFIMFITHVAYVICVQRMRNIVRQPWQCARSANFKAKVHRMFALYNVCYLIIIGSGLYQFEKKRERGEEEER